MGRARRTDAYGDRFRWRIGAALRRYGAAALDVVRSNPYRLAEEIFGVGFLTADRIARQTGIPADAPERLEAELNRPDLVLVDLCKPEVFAQAHLPRM